MFAHIGNSVHRISTFCKLLGRLIRRPILRVKIIIVGKRIGNSSNKIIDPKFQFDFYTSQTYNIFHRLATVHTAADWSKIDTLTPQYDRTNKKPTIRWDEVKRAPLNSKNFLHFRESSVAFRPSPLPWPIK